MNPLLDVLKDSLRHQLEIKKGLEQKASFLTALSGVIVGFSISRLDAPEFTILGISSFATVITAILSVFLPFRRSLKGGGSLICWWGFPATEAEYRQAIQSRVASEAGAADEYQKEIWTLSQYSIRPKTKLLTVASLTLIVGLVAALVLFFV